MKLSAVCRCIELISQSVAKLPIYCVNKKTHERVDHDILYLLNVRPNDAMTPSVERQMVDEFAQTCTQNDGCVGQLGHTAAYVIGSVSDFFKPVDVFFLHDDKCVWFGSCR